MLLYLIFANKTNIQSTKLQNHPNTYLNNIEVRFYLSITAFICTLTTPSWLYYVQMYFYMCTCVYGKYTCACNATQSEPQSFTHSVQFVCSCLLTLYGHIRKRHIAFTSTEMQWSGKQNSCSDIILLISNYFTHFRVSMRVYWLV